MDIISKANGVWQELDARSMRVYDRGLTIPREGMHFIPSSKNREKRGAITSFSVKSRKRLRAVLLSHSIEGAFRCGVTFTVPWKGDNFEPLMDEFRECWHRFTVAFRRQFKHSGLIYRVELQQRGAPHIHALSFIDETDLANNFPAPARAQVRESSSADQVALVDWCLGLMWRHSVSDLHYGSMRHFVSYGVKVEGIPNDGAFFRYVADHTSKQKQAQLGYKGKQWGLVGASNFKVARGFEVAAFLSDRHRVLFLRGLLKLMRYRLSAFKHPRWKRRPPFGSVLKGSKRIVGDFYIISETTRRLWVCTALMSLYVTRKELIYG